MGNGGTRPCGQEWWLYLGYLLLHGITMQRINEEFRFKVTRTVWHRTKLFVAGIPVAIFPYTYTFRECLDEFCDAYGWTYDVYGVAPRPAEDRGGVEFSRPSECCSFISAIRFARDQLVRQEMDV